MNNIFYQCDHCSFESPNRENINNHVKNHFKYVEASEVTCSFCKKVFQNKQSMVQHLRTHNVTKGIFPCESCGKVFNSKAMMNMHFNSYHVHGEYTCKTCNLVLKRKIDLYSHNSKKHGTVDAVKIACEICGKLVAPGKLYQRHVRMIHRKIEVNDKPKRKSTKTPMKATVHRVTCRYCPKVLGRNRIKNHVSCHNRQQHSFD